MKRVVTWRLRQDVNGILVPTDDALRGVHLESQSLVMDDEISFQLSMIFARRSEADTQPVQDLHHQGKQANDAETDKQVFPHAR